MATASSSSGGGGSDGQPAAAAVERDLGEVRAFLDSAPQAGHDLLGDLVALKLNGPAEPNSVASLAASGAGYEATDFTIRCTGHW